jgi:hypothetical protein
MTESVAYLTRSMPSHEKQLTRAAPHKNHALLLHLLLTRSISQSHLHHKIKNNRMRIV